MASSILATWFVSLVVLFVARPASAHVVGLSTGEYVAKGSSVVATLAFARVEIAALAPAVDADGDGHLTALELHDARALLEQKVFGRISVTSGGAACRSALTDAGLTELDGLLLAGRWDCAGARAPFVLDVAIFDDLARGHRHVARVVSGDATHDEVLDVARRTLTLERAGTGDSVPAGEGSPPTEVSKEGAKKEAPPSTALAFFVLGIEHILTGYDHLVFLLALVLAPARPRALLGIVTAFTIAHSITLAVSTLGVWAPSDRLVEPAIALSIAYVGVENFFVQDANQRWRITFPFGLIHGFGFAGALTQIALPRSALPSALVAFNLGVEAGQVVVLALLLALLRPLRREAWFNDTGARVASGAVALAGVAWFLARVA